MRTEEQVRELYKQYVYNHAVALNERNTIAAHQYFGAAIACGRTLGKDMRRIIKDIDITKDFLRRENQED